MVLALDVNKYGFEFKLGEYRSKELTEDGKPMWTVHIKYQEGTRLTWLRVSKREQYKGNWFTRPKFDGYITKTEELHWVFGAVGVL